MIIDPIIRAHKLFEAKSKLISTIEDLTSGKGKKYVTLKTLQKELDLDDAAFTDVMKGAYDANRHSNKYIMTHVDDEPAIGITAQKRKRKAREAEGMSTNGSVGLASRHSDEQTAKDMKNELVKKLRESELWSVYKKQGWKGLDKMGVLKEGWQNLSDTQLIESIVNEEYGSFYEAKTPQVTAALVAVPQRLSKAVWMEHLVRVIRKDRIQDYNNFGSDLLSEIALADDDTAAVVSDIEELRDLWQSIHVSLIVVLAALQRWEVIEKMARLPQSDIGASDIIDEGGALVDIHIVRSILKRPRSVRVAYNRHIDTLENHIEHFTNGKFGANELLKGAVDLDPSEEYLVDEAAEDYIEIPQDEVVADDIPYVITTLKRLDRKLGLSDQFWKSLTRVLRLNNITAYLDFVDMTLSKELIQFDVERGAEDSNEAVIEWLETMWHNMHVELIKALVMLGKRDVVEKLGKLKVSTEMLYSNDSALDTDFDDNIIRTLLRTASVVRVWHGTRFVKLSEVLDAAQTLDQL